MQKDKSEKVKDNIALSRVYRINNNRTIFVPLRYIMIGKPSAESKQGITNDYIK
jgi:hypothetical protein